MASRIPNLTLVAPDQSGKEYTINHALNALSPAGLFARRDAECSGLSWYYHGGWLVTDGQFISIENNATPLVLAANATNYIHATRSGSVATSTSGFPPGSIPLYVANTSASTCTDYNDVRQFGMCGQLAIGSADAGGGDVVLSWAQARLDFVSITGALSANRSVIVPNVWAGTVHNDTSGAYTLTVKTVGGTGVSVAPGERCSLLADGVNVVSIGGSGGGGGGAAILAGQTGGQRLIGGTDPADKLELQATSGAASSGEGIALLVGANGGTKAAAVLHDGKVQVGTASTNGLLNVGGKAYVCPTDASDIAILGESTGDGTAVFAKSNRGNAGRFTQIGTLSANCTTSVVSVARASTGSYNVSGDVVVVDDSPGVTGAVSGMLFRGYCDGLTRVSLNPRVVDGASAVAHFFSTASVLANASARLLSIRNQGTEKFAIKANGGLALTTPSDYADDATAAAGGIAVGEVYRTGSVLKVRVT